MLSISLKSEVLKSQEAAVYKHFVPNGTFSDRLLKRGVNETDLVKAAPSGNTTLGHYQISGDILFENC